MTPWEGGGRPAGTGGGHWSNLGPFSGVGWSGKSSEGGGHEGMMVVREQEACGDPVYRLLQRIAINSKSDLRYLRDE